MNEPLNQSSHGLWPGKPAAFRRLFLITLFFFPISWAIYALLVGDWGLDMAAPNAESWRHLIQWIILLTISIAVAFWISLLPVFAGLFSPRALRRILITLAWTASLLALFYAEEDWRGRHEWDAYRHELEEQGARLDFTNYIPRPIPDDRNFAATPVVQSWFILADTNIYTNTTFRYVQYWNDNYSFAENMLAEDQKKNIRHFSDLVAWGKAFDAVQTGQTNVSQKFVLDDPDSAHRAAAAPSVLAGLQTNETMLAELSAASQRPASRYPVFYDLDNPPGIYLPHLLNIRNAIRRLSLRACAELAAGHRDEALADVKLSLYLADTVKDEPFLISHLVRVVSVQGAMQPVWEGLAQHIWTDAQLQELQQLLLTYNPLSSLKNCCAAERADRMLIADLIQKKGLGYIISIVGWDSPLSMSGKFATWCGGLMPSGWLDLEKLNYCRLYEQQINGTFNATRKTVSPSQITSNNAVLGRLLRVGQSARGPITFLHHRLLATALMSDFGPILYHTATSQTVVNEAVIACALERYRLAKGKYPETLDGLAPQYLPLLPSPSGGLEPQFNHELPHDLFSGEAYKYRPTNDGKFVLYSVGWNEKDDGGIPGEALFDQKQGDWIW